MDMFKLKRDKDYQTNRIRISYNTGPVSNDLSVYLYDEDGKSHLVYWNIQPDTCHQSFDNTNDKVKQYIKTVVEGWIKTEEDEDMKRIEAEKRRKMSEEDKVKSLLDNF